MTIDEKYERELVKKQAELSARIDAIYRTFMNEIAPILGGQLQKQALQRAINAAISELGRKLTTEIVSGIRSSWDLSNAKNAAYLDRRLKEVAPDLLDDLPKGVKKVWYDPNKDALREFIKRDRNGLNLSKRIHKQTAIARRSISKQLKEGIGEGRSAVKIARTLRDTLVEPGNNPVYNTQRVARTETNMAYRRADHEAWVKDPAILGYEIQLSNTQSKKVKARCELCVKLAGKYPVTFIFLGWHPNCLCYKTPIEMTDEQFARYLKLIAEGRDSKSALDKIRKDASLITDVPDGFKQWVSDNEKRVSGWANPPYWVQDNFKGGKIGKGLLTVKGSKALPNPVPLSKTFVPSGIDAYEKKFGVKIDRGIFGYLNKETPIRELNNGIYYHPVDNFVNLQYHERFTKSKWMAEGVIYHEYGHAADQQRGVKSMPEVKGLMDKYRGYYKDRFSDLSQNAWSDFKESARLATHDRTEQLVAMADTIMALDKNYGFGHDMKYFSRPGTSEAEFIAHAFENKFLGNPVFKERMPELYQEMIDLINSLLK